MIYRLLFAAQRDIRAWEGSCMYLVDRKSGGIFCYLRWRALRAAIISTFLWGWLIMLRRLSTNQVPAVAIWTVSVLCAPNLHACGRILKVRPFFSFLEITETLNKCKPIRPALFTPPSSLSPSTDEIPFVFKEQGSKGKAFLGSHLRNRKRIPL